MVTPTEPAHDGSRTFPPEERGRVLEPGAIVGRLVVLHELGAGGMGVVHAAYDPELDRKVALKLLLPGRGGDKARRRLLREAQALGKLAHPNVVGIHDVGTIGAQVWLAMEFVQGQTLGAWLGTPRGWREVLAVMRSAGEGLAAAHAAGLLHRDFKPDNVMIGDDGRVRVMDFGLARARVSESLAVERSRPSPTVETLALQITQAGALVGTPGYMAPEQFKHEELTAAVDQFAFCVTLWEALYGERPFVGGSLMSLIANVLGGEPQPPPKRRAIPRRLRRACERGLSVDPQARWPSMQALLVELRRLAAPRRWWALGLAAGLAAVGLGIGQYAEVGFRCEGAEAQLEGIWDDERKAEVEAAILGTALPYAPGTWERVEQRLDGYRAAWIDEHTEACEATRVTEAQTEQAMGLRMGCLAERRTALRAAVDALVVADEEAVEHAVELVAGLPTLRHCDDVERLEQQRQRVPPPEDPQAAQEVEALRERLADIKAKPAGEHSHALADVELVVERAEALAYWPLLAEARHRRGALLNYGGQYVEAEQELKQAYVLALEHEHDEVALHAAQLLTRVVGVRQARPAEGLVWGDTAMPLAERSGDPIEVATSSNALGLVLQREGEYERAELHYQRAAQIVEQALGADHPQLAMTLINLGTLLASQGEYEQAKPHYQRALQVLEQALGPDHPNVATGLNNLGNVFGGQGEYEQAKLHYQRALRIREKALGADHPDVAASLNNLGNVLGSQGDHEQARLLYRRALQIREKTLGADHPEVANGLNNLAYELELQGEHEQAERHYQRALQILEKQPGAAHPQLAYPLLGLVRVALLQTQFDAARSHAERVVAMLEASKPLPGVLAEARYLLASALWPDRSQHARAHALAQQARDAYAELGDDEGLDKVERWLAEHAVP